MSSVWHFNHNSPYSAFLYIKAVISKDQACQRQLHLAELVTKYHTTFPDYLLKISLYYPPALPGATPVLNIVRQSQPPYLLNHPSPASASTSLPQKSHSEEDYSLFLCIPIQKPETRKFYKYFSLKKNPKPTLNSNLNLTDF